jgi:hypothetical protein
MTLEKLLHQESTVETYFADATAGHGVVPPN